MVTWLLFPLITQTMEALLLQLVRMKTFSLLLTIDRLFESTGLDDLTKLKERHCCSSSRIECHGCPCGPQCTDRLTDH